MSKFGDLKSARLRSSEPAAEQPSSIPLPSPAPVKVKKKGKRVDPTFVQVSAYISDDLNRRVKAALVAKRRERDFSGVVSELLEAWLLA